MEIDFKTCSEKELWHYVAVHLKRKGIDTVLVGGAVVSIYSDGAYRSGDLDLVKTSLFVTKLEEAMNELNFKREGRHYIHKDCQHLFVEFPGGPPLGIGDDNEIAPDSLSVDGVIIKILSPTDCVKDRLASYIYFKTRDALDQALLVAKMQPIKFHDVKKWCLGEKHPEVFEEFMALLKIGN